MALRRFADRLDGCFTVLYLTEPCHWPPSAQVSGKGVPNGECGIPCSRLWVLLQIGILLSLAHILHLSMQVLLALYMAHLNTLAHNLSLSVI